MTTARMTTARHDLVVAGAAAFRRPASPSSQPAETVEPAAATATGDPLAAELT